MSAVIAFLREVRDKKGISQTEVAIAAGLSLRQIGRWETEDKGGKIGTESFLKVVTFLGVPLDHVNQLLLDKEATDEHGRAQAQDWLEQLDARAARDAARMSDDELDATIAAMEEKLRNAPELLVRVTAFLEGLLEGQSAAATSRSDTHASTRRRWLGRKRKRSNGTSK